MSESGKAMVVRAWKSPRCGVLWTDRPGPEHCPDGTDTHVEDGCGCGPPMELVSQSDALVTIDAARAMEREKQLAEAKALMVEAGDYLDHSHGCIVRIYLTGKCNCNRNDFIVRFETAAGVR